MKMPKVVHERRGRAGCNRGGGGEGRLWWGGRESPTNEKGGRGTEANPVKTGRHGSAKVLTGAATRKSSGGQMESLKAKKCEDQTVNVRHSSNSGQFLLIPRVIVGNSRTKGWLNRLLAEKWDSKSPGARGKSDRQTRAGHCKRTTARVCSHRRV